MIAISAEALGGALATTALLKEQGSPVDFPILCDPERKTVKSFGVFDSEHNIALPAIVILDKRGCVSWKYVATSVMDRAEEAAIIEQLKKMTGS